MLSLALMHVTRYSGQRQSLLLHETNRLSNSMQPSQICCFHSVQVAVKECSLLLTRYTSSFPIRRVARVAFSRR